MVALLVASAGLLWVARSLGEGAFSTAAGETSLDATVPHRRGRNPTMILKLKIDIEYLKWLWWPFLLYLFWGMAHICDEYFVRAIEVISDRFNIPDDVAGATLMALGCNGPEMSLNTISIFNPSDIGVGAVIGGEVFNVLVIIGAAMLATPQKYLPLEVSPFSFGRDVSFYMVSVMILYFILRDGFISRRETLVLLGGAVCYSTTVIFSSRIRKVCIMIMHRCAGWNVLVDGCASQAEVDFNPAPSISSVNSLSHSLSDSVPNEEKVKAWAHERKCEDPAEGSVLFVRADVRSRMADQYHAHFRRFIWLTKDTLMVSAAVEPGCASKGKEFNVLVYDRGLRLRHHGGLVNVPDHNDPPFFRGKDTTPASDLIEPLHMFRQVSDMPLKAQDLGITTIPCESIPLEDVLYCDPVQGQHTMFTIHVHERIHERHMGVGRLITLELIAETQAVHDAWVEALRNVLRERAHLSSCADQPPPPKSWNIILEEVVAWFQFPVRLLASLTIPDMDNPAWQNWYPVAFFMSMAWLAVFAFLVVESCHGIHKDFGISTGLLGFTIAAAGTSFPNVFSGMVVSRQGKTCMALANALGANVQNVFLALAIPWTIKAWFLSNGRFAMPVQGLEAQIAEIYITLLPVCSILLFYKGKLPGWSGPVFLITYFLYLVVALGQESTCCETWPFLRCAEEQVVC